MSLSSIKLNKTSLRFSTDLKRSMKLDFLFPEYLNKCHRGHRGRKCPLNLFLEHFLTLRNMSLITYYTKIQIK